MLKHETNALDLSAVFSLFPSVLVHEIRKTKQLEIKLYLESFYDI